MNDWRQRNVLMKDDPYYFTKYVGDNSNWRGTQQYASLLKNAPYLDNKDHYYASKLNTFDQSSLVSDGYRYKHDWDYMQSRFQDVPERKLPDDEPYMHVPMPVSGPYPKPLGPVSMRGDLPTSQYDANVVQAELLKGAQPFYEAVEDAEMYYRDDGNMPGPNSEYVIDAITTARQQYPAVRQHLMNMHGGVSSDMKGMVKDLVQELDQAEMKVEEIAQDLNGKGGPKPKKSKSFQFSSSKLAGTDNNKKMFCCFVIFLILLAAVMAGAAWCRGAKCHKMRW